MLQSQNRRHFLRGLGACVALPSMESLVSGSASAASAAVAEPVKAAFVYVPNGVVMSKWWPEFLKGGKDFQLGSSMQALNDYKKDIQVVRG